MGRLTLLCLCLGCGGKDAVDPAPEACAPLPAAGDLRVGPDAADNLVLTLDGCDLGRLEPAVVGEGSLSLSWRPIAGGWQPILTAGSGGATLTALRLRGELGLGGVEAPVLWRQGYQSWSWSGVTALPETLAMDGAIPAVGGDGDGLDVVNEVDGTSWWVGLVGRPAGSSLLAGALRASQSRIYTAFAPAGDGVEAWVVWTDSPLAIAEGAELALDPLILSYGADPNALMADYADAAAAYTAPRDLPARPPVGWASWTVSYAEVTEAEVRATLEAAAALRDDPSLQPLDIIQVDDGWEQAWGDWTANDRFPSGMGPLAADIAAAGFVPGLWMAPFYVATTTDTYRDHADWWVRDETGAPITYRNAGQDLVIIDVTVPEALDWMGQQVADRVAEGFVYLKLDFLYAGAQEGQRAQPISGMAAYQLGLARLRQAAGDAYILACGAPLLPSLGQVEGMRTGADIAFAADPDPRLGYLRWQGRSTAARAAFNGRWWWGDADTMLLREPFTTVEASGAVVANAVSGGAWLLGDDLTTLPDDKLRLALDADTTALLGEAATPEDPLSAVSILDGSPIMEQALQDDVVPTRWQFPDGTVALLNLGEETVTVDGPGGAERLTGATAAPGPRTLAPGQGELWAP